MNLEITGALSASPCGMTCKKFTEKCDNTHTHTHIYFTYIVNIYCKHICANIVSSHIFPTAVLAQRSATTGTTGTPGYTRLGFMSAAQLVRKFSSSAVAPRRKMGPFSNGWPTMVA